MLREDEGCLIGRYDGSMHMCHQNCIVKGVYNMDASGMEADESTLGNERDSRQIGLRIIRSLWRLGNNRHCNEGETKAGWLGANHEEFMSASNNSRRPQLSAVRIVWRCLMEVTETTLESG